MMLKKTVKTCLALMAAPLFLTGCEGALVMERTARFVEGIIKGQEVNINAKSYAAADYLDQQIRTFITHDDVVKALPLYSSLNAGDDSVQLSTLVPYQVGSRLMQLGYSVDLTQVSDMSGAEKARKARFVLSGSFERQKQGLHLYRGVDVRLMIRDVKTDKMIAAFNYILPRNREVFELSKPPEVVKPEEEIEEKNKEPFSKTDNLM